MPRDYYEVLGVDRGALDADIKKAFRRLARELHPDVNRHDPAAEEKFKEAAEAYEILSDSERRAVYDRFGFEGLDSRGYAPAGHGFGSFADIFDAFFGGDPFGFGRGGFGGGPGRVQGGDAAVEVDVTLEQAARGVAVEVPYELVDTCDRCHGNGAEPGTPIKTCPRCEGTGQLRSVTRTAFGQLVRSHPCDNCGGEGTVATLDGEREVEVPAGTQPGTVVTLRGLGMPSLGRGRRGDQRVVLNVVVPRNLNARQRELVDDLNASLTEHNLHEPEDESLFHKVRRAFR